MLRTCSAGAQGSCLLTWGGGMAGVGVSRSRHISGLVLKPLLSCRPPADHFVFFFFLTSSTQPALPQPGPSGDVKRSVQCTRHGTAGHTGHAGSLPSRACGMGRGEAAPGTSACKQRADPGSQPPCRHRQSLPSSCGGGANRSWR